MEKFDETKPEHLKALEYFALDAGHPRFFLDGEIVDVDIEFRDFIVAHLNLPVSEDDGNGSVIELINRIDDNATIATHFEWYDENDNSYELKVEFSGKLLLEELEVVFNPDISTLKVLVPFDKICEDEDEDDC